MSTPRWIPAPELRPVEAPAEMGPGARAFVLLPTLEEILGIPGFAASDPIMLPGASRPLDGWTLFGTGGWILH
ncbi:MAG: hypothetical protein M5U07_15320 [Xanthobacteraceae bacterium]|nr:hypothetical protein [Xanthobacteraceae bacterium]PWB64856.1 MAG: hypothetical protein C3F17_05840 [Bradyrhizobiaceae bacterium]